jgi:hypothetical protein
MNNFLDNGTVLPHGLLGHSEDLLQGFNKTYRNTAMRVGVIVACYPTTHERNRSKIATEYDVVAMEQNEDKGATTTLYRNCLSSSGLTAIADFFEVTLRTRKAKKYKGDAVRMAEQNGSVVLLLCLDGSSERAMIIGGFPHPDRKTTLKDDKPHLEAEYNGINIKIEADGSTTLTFKGATDNDGKLVNDKQEPTTMKIEKDGSYQFDHKTIKQRFDVKGKADLTADDDISNTTKKSFNVTATENVAIKATKTMSADVKELTVKASGSATFETESLSVKASSSIKFEGSQYQVEASSMAKIKAATITLDGMVSLGGDGGQPILLLSTQFIGTGNLGLPVMSTAIAGYATKVTAQ